MIIGPQFKHDEEKDRLKYLTQVMYYDKLLSVNQVWFPEIYNTTILL